MSDESAVPSFLPQGTVEIVEFRVGDAKHKQAFRDLNVEWISKYFVMEEADFKSLDHPQEYILDKGGRIFIAEIDGTAVGTCGLVKMDDHCYEVVKMSVSPAAQGRGIGKLLMDAAMAKAREIGATRLYIESNTMLTPAITLYKKSGFVEIVGGVSPYQRCNIQLELFL